MSVVIETTLGDITVDLYLKERPRACLNFIKLCKLKYYNYNLFHTIEQGFIAQTGDPSGTGNEGVSVWGVIEGSFKRFFEAESLPKIRHTEPGLLSMVSTGNNMIGSQFFFTLGSDLTSLDGIHCVIGEVTEGHDILRKINEAICDPSHRPYQDIRITHTIILEDPFDNPRGFREPSKSPSPTPERLKNGRIGADEQIDDTAGKTEIEIHEMLADREAKARATILEIVGDLPDAEIAPPENVLFVCKLNPVTTDDDLEIIFSRFGKIKGCEVIRDKVSGDSLQYAFVEFEDKKSCEDAYFKMDNVLIDDRRIHVDFSQSVAKVKWIGKGRGVVYADKNDVNKTIDFSKRNDNSRNYNQNKQYNQRPRDQNYERRHDKQLSIRDERRREENRTKSPIFTNNRSNHIDRYQRNRSRSPIKNRRNRDRYGNRETRSPIEDQRNRDRYGKGSNRERSTDRRKNNDFRRNNSKSRSPQNRGKIKDYDNSYRKKQRSRSPSPLVSKSNRRSKSREKLKKDHRSKKSSKKSHKKKKKRSSSSSSSS